MGIDKYGKMEAIKKLLSDGSEKASAEIRYHLGLVHYEAQALLEEMYADGVLEKIKVGRRWVRWKLKTKVESTGSEKDFRLPSY